jgi:hypothetical protein
MYILPKQRIDKGNISGMAVPYVNVVNTMLTIEEYLA